MLKAHCLQSNGTFNKDFLKNSRQGRLIEPVLKVRKYGFETVEKNQIHNWEILQKSF